MKPKQRAALEEFLDAQRALYNAALNLSETLGLCDDQTDDEKGWTLPMWLYQAPLFTSAQVEEIIRKRFEPRKGTNEN